MPCTEAYKEHIMYTFHVFCKVIIRNAAITAWRNQHRWHKREISLEYLTEERFYGITASESDMQPLRTDASTRTRRTA